MELLEALETYLLETGQISALARRQARLLCRSVADERLQKEAQLLLLLNLTALAKGAPRAPEVFLLKPLDKDVVKQYIDVYTVEHPGSRPEWEAILSNAGTLKEARKILDASVQSPLRLAPLTGKEPQDKDARRYPLLIIGSMQQGACMGFARYWRAATLLEKAILNRLNQPPVAIPDDTAIAAINHVFGTDSILAGEDKFHYRQAAAAALALRTRFLIVSGGPGTGKTRVVTQILRTLLRADTAIQPDRIVLCAPTGRAKARLGESIKNGIEDLEKKPGASQADGRTLDLSLKDLQCKTIHGLLGSRPDGSMKYDENNPLPHQVIVVDETSMVDLHLFSALLEAAGKECRIILVGDMHQLPSVEAGTVLGDLTRRFTGNQTLTQEVADWLNKVISAVAPGETPEDNCAFSTPGLKEEAGPLVDHTIILTRSYRSAREILKISGYVNNGEPGNALQYLDEIKDTHIVDLDTAGGIDPVKKWLGACYTKDKLAPVKALSGLDLDAVDNSSHRDHAAVLDRLEAVFEVFDEFRILTLANEGRRGRIAINALADTLLRPQLDAGRRKEFFHGQQVIITQNLHGLDLFNGDTGIVVQSKNAGQKVIFRRGKNFSIHALERLTGLEPAFAMTVHKAQGSEFDTVLLVLPEYESPLLTRQILYTGLTRAKKRIRILGTAALLQHAIETKEERPGGVEL
jgi:exodeoxyribonuclease V alpha subunit